MVSFKNIYHVFEETIPLYTTMILAYLSIKLWNLFNSEQINGINKFVSKFSIPLLSYQVISSNNPYQMNLKLVLSDIIQKTLLFFIFVLITRVFFRNNFDRLITGFSVSTLPNTLIIGIPLLKGMYGDLAVDLITQIVVLQSLVWYIFLLVLFEFRATKKISNDNQNAAHVSEEILESHHEEMQVNGGNDEKALSKRYLRVLSFISIIARKLLINPNTYASLAGLIWSLISFRWNIKLPKIINNCIHILSDGGLGMAMFSLGLFMASQSKIIACGARMAVLSLCLRFILGPALMAIASYAIGLRGLLLKIAIIQAALPQGIVPFVFAKEYEVHPDILSTGIIIGMIIAVPVALAYYFLLGPE